MKIKRYKHSKKLTAFYASNFGFRAPYLVLIDGTFCQVALKDRINICEQLPKYLDAEVSCSTTPCILHELETLGSRVYGALHIAKQFKLVNCGHQDAPILPAKCLLSMVKRKNPAHYWIASQDPELKNVLESYVAVPRLFISHNAMHIAHVPRKTSTFAEKKADSRCNEYLSQDLKVLRELKSEFKCQEDAPEKKSKNKVKKKKQANPLSCKKQTRQKAKKEL